nr:hypothetical protein [uncultured Brevundimonas sp.]
MTLRVISSRRGLGFTRLPFLLGRAGIDGRRRRGQGGLARGLKLLDRQLGLQPLLLGQGLALCGLIAQAVHLDPMLVGDGRAGVVSGRRRTRPAGPGLGVRGQRRGGHQQEHEDQAAHKTKMGARPPCAKRGPRWRS